MPDLTIDNMHEVRMWQSTELPCIRPFPSTQSGCVAATHIEAGMSSQSVGVAWNVATEIDNSAQYIMATNNGNSTVDHGMLDRRRGATPHVAYNCALNSQLPRARHYLKHMKNKLESAYMCGELN